MAGNMGISLTKNRKSICWNMEDGGISINMIYKLYLFCFIVGDIIGNIISLAILWGYRWFELIRSI